MAELEPSRSKEEGFRGVKLLVEKFSKYAATGAAEKLNEAQTRNEFIEPLFSFLGWDMRNLANLDEVVTEYSVSKGRVDLAFNIRGETAMLVEAKSIKINLNDWKWATQAINYSWNRAVKWAILTDFQGIRILNSEVPPTNLAENLYLDLTWDKYLDEFDKLWLLSKESMEAGALDRAAKNWKRSPKVASVSSLLFESLADWRETLAIEWESGRDLSEHEKDEAVQKFLDRVIFIRTAEDRGLSKKELLDITREDNPSTSWSRLTKLFRSYDQKFNSKLFAEHPLDVRPFSHEKVMQVLRGFYEAPDGYVYDFSAITGDILGGVYEKYLSLTQLPESERTSKSKRKLRGIFYTPRQIVDYLLANSLDELLAEGLEPRNIRVLDPACGSGTFLVSTFERLVRARSKQGALTLLDELEIVTDNLFGVDIDSQATELARLNLLLKCLKSDGQLPDLSSNIKEANTLLIPDITSIGGGFGDLEVDDVPLDIKRDFPQLAGSDGFDLIIGNPPYVFTRGESFTEPMKRHLEANYSVAQFKLNTYSLFIERSFQLLKPGGYLAFIVPNTWLTILTFSHLRKFLAKNTEKLKIVNVLDKVFPEASVDVSLIVAKKGTGNYLEILELKGGRYSTKCKADKSLIEGGGPISISALSNPIAMSILDKIASKSRTLEECASVRSGLQAYEVGKGDPIQTKEMQDARIYHHMKPETSSSRRYLQGRDVCRYGLDWSGEWLDYGPNLAARRDPKIFEGERIIVRQIPSKPPYCINSALTEEDFVHDINSHVILDFKEINARVILAVLNSKLISCWFVHYFDKLQRKTFPQFKTTELAQFPIPSLGPEFSQKLDELASLNIALHKRLADHSPGFSNHDAISRQILEVETKIDELLADHFDLSKEEVTYLEKYHSQYV